MITMGEEIVRPCIHCGAQYFVERMIYVVLPVKRGNGYYVCTKCWDSGKQ